MSNSKSGAQVPAPIPPDGFQITGDEEMAAFSDFLSLIQSRGAPTADNYQEIVTALVGLSQSQDLQIRISLRAPAEGVDGNSGFAAPQSAIGYSLVEPEVTIRESRELGCVTPV